ncbi:hypothetical protein GGI07_005533 [Coemansia sp. Benny D115]|nr:hypothetical protein GGI07_005533 [Coemansia sp. Benny D115]
MDSSDRASEHTLSAGDTRDTTGLYMTLGVDQAATAQEIKRAYRRLALQFHPDRNPGAGPQFVRIQYAYDVLSDERKRRIYDRYGDIGVQMAGRVGGELFDPQVSNLLSAFAFASALVALLLVVFFALLARRVDRAVEWPYKVVFAPLWLADTLVVAGVAAAVVAARTKYWTSQERQPDEDGEPENGHCSDMDADVERAAGYADGGGCSGLQGGCMAEAGRAGGAYSAYGAPPRSSCSTASSSSLAHSIADAQQIRSAVAGNCASDTTPLLSASSRHAGSGGSHRRSSNSRRHRMRALRKHLETLSGSLVRAAPLAYLLLLVTFQILLVLKLDGDADWSPWTVAAPWLCIEAIHFVLLTLQFLAALLQMRGRASGGLLPSRAALVLASSSYWWFAIRLSQAVLILLRLDGTIGWAWALVFVPAYIPFVWTAVSISLLPRQLRSMGDSEIAQNSRAIVVACLVVFVIASSFFYSFVALLAWKLSAPSAVRLALVLIPVFAALAIVCCCCSCISCCLAYGMHAPLDDGQAAESHYSSVSPTDSPAATRARIPASRRIDVAQPQSV